MPQRHYKHKQKNNGGFSGLKISRSNESGPVHSYLIGADAVGLLYESLWGLGVILTFFFQMPDSFKGYCGEDRERPFEYQ